jgi:hypothetical protein
MHLLSQIMYFCKTLYMFRTVFPSIIRSSKLRIEQQHMSNSCCYLLLSNMRWNGAPTHLTLYPLYRGLGGPRGRSGKHGNLIHNRIRSPDRRVCMKSIQRLHDSSHPDIKGRAEKTASLRDCISSSNNLRVTTSSCMKWVGHVTQIGEDFC